MLASHLPFAFHIRTDFVTPPFMAEIKEKSSAGFSPEAHSHNSTTRHFKIPVGKMFNLYNATVNAKYVSRPYSGLKPGSPLAPSSALKGGVNKITSFSSSYNQ